MAGRKKPVLRLTIFFISIVLVSGSILAYLSITHISNLKDLTEKRIQEEQKNLAQTIARFFENEINGLAEMFSDLGKKKHIPKESASVALDTTDKLDHIFAINNKGKFLWPWYIDGSQNQYRSVAISDAQLQFQKAEQAEFIQKDFFKARKRYQSSLKESSDAIDSVQSLNALARLAVKMNDGTQAFRNYALIIDKYSSLCDRNGFPYAYYAIPQLIRISNPSNYDSVAEKICLILNGIESGTIPLNQSTRNIMQQVSDWIRSDLRPSESLQSAEESILNIEKYIKFLDRNRQLIRGYILGGSDEEFHRISAGYHVLTGSNLSRDEVLLINRGADLSTGFSLTIDQLWANLHESNLTDLSEYKFTFELRRKSNGVRPAGDPLSFSFEPGPYFPDYEILIKPGDEKLIAKFVKRRSWIYGITFALLLGGMILGIMLILRDISREEHLARLRADFISNVTHELKTPLTSIQLFSESMALQRIKSEDHRKEYLNIILKESENLKRMINNILDFSREGKGKREYHFQEVNMSALVHDSITDLEYWLVEKNFTLHKEIGDNILAIADPDAMKQAIINLLNNAIKFSLNQKEIAVILKKEHEYVLIQIEDKGIGIPDDQKDLIFQPFYRVGQNNSEDISGTGLGLSVVKEIVEAHHGIITVSSRINEGSSFTIQFNVNQKTLA